MATYEVNQLNITKDGNTYQFRGGGSGNGILYGTSNTAADVQAKTVTIEGISEYTEGLSVRIKFVNGQTYDGAPTLNINSLGAKNVQTVSGTLGMRYMWRAGEVVDFIYDGTAFIEVNGGISTTDYYGVTKLSNAVNSESTYVAATPYAVKQAYDKAEALTSKLAKGLSYIAEQSGNNWILPTGTNAVSGDFISVDGIMGQATAAIVGGTDAIVEGINWSQCPSGALNALNSNMLYYDQVYFGFTGVTFENRGGWYRANVPISSITSITPSSVVLVCVALWSGTGCPVIAQLDSDKVQFIAPTNVTGGSVQVRILHIK